MNRSIILEISRDDWRIRVSVHERNDSIEKTLLPYDEYEVDWTQVEACCSEVISLLGRANKRAQVAPEILSGLKKSGQVLFDLLVPSKVREKLNATTAVNLTLHLDDKLVHIPWELLFNGRDFLCRRFGMGRIVKTRQTLTSLSSRTLRSPIKLLVLADSQGDLGASYREGIDLRNLLDEKAEAIRVDFKSHPLDVSYVKKNLRDYDIVHYAGHADYHAEDPSDSGWLLTDGRLRAREISAMGGLSPMPLMIFSNACQSGQSGDWQIQDGYEQKVFGLANAFLLSGVQHYIGTFWEILDEPSLHFAKSFYTRVAQGERVGEALRRARADLIETFSEETILWASYMLYGDPTFTFSPAMREDSIKPATHETARTELGQMVRGETVVLASAAKTWASPYLYTFLGMFILFLAFLGYSRLDPNFRDGKNAFSLASLLTSSSSSETNGSLSNAPITLSMNIIGQRKEADGTYTEVFVREGSTLRSRDNFQVHLQTNRPSYLYVLLYDSQGRASQIFPHPKIDQAGFVEASRRIVVPDKNLWFWLDENTGTETIYVLASEKPMSDIGGLMDKMEAASSGEKKRISQEVKDKIKLVQRGVGGISKGKAATYTLSDGQVIEKVTEVVSGTGAVVRAVGFKHR
jgi:CHAT domain-containing protein